MAAKDQLIAYGYVKCEDGKYRRQGKSTQVWQELEDGKGWLRFDPDGQGHEVPEVYCVSTAYQGTSGLSKLHHPDAFDWVWSEACVEEMYRVGVAAQAEQLHAAMGRKGQYAAIAKSVSIPTPTAAQLTSMQNAQVGQVAVAKPKDKDKEPETIHKRHWWE